MTTLQKHILPELLQIADDGLGIFAREEHLVRREQCAYLLREMANWSSQLSKLPRT